MTLNLNEYQVINWVQLCNPRLYLRIISFQWTSMWSRNYLVGENPSDFNEGIPQNVCSWWFAYCVGGGERISWAMQWTLMQLVLKEFMPGLELMGVREKLSSIVRWMVNFTHVETFNQFEWRNFDSLAVCLIINLSSASATACEPIVTV